MENEYTPKNKKLYRDADNRVIAGVCAGMAHFFKLNPIIVRLGFLLFVILYGSGIILYLILCLCIPTADTPVKRLEMKGEEINDKNIEREIQYLSGAGTCPNQRSCLGPALLGCLSLPILLIGASGLFVLFGLLFSFSLPLTDPFFDTPHNFLHSLTSMISQIGLLHSFPALGSLLLVIILPLALIIWSLTKKDNHKSTLPIWILAVVIWLIALITLGSKTLDLIRNNITDEYSYSSARYEEENNDNEEEDSIFIK